MVRNETQLVLSKVEAATRQLETAITLYFQNGDPVSIHTLACAAHEIIETLNRKGGGPPTLREDFKQHIRPAFVKEFAQKLNAARNFFKHADRDHDAVIRFSQFESEVVLVDACATHRRLAGGGLPRPLIGTFLLWSALTWARDVLVYDGMDVDSDFARHLAELSREAFFAEVLPVALRAQTVHE